MPLHRAVTYLKTYMSSPCHIKLVLVEKEQAYAKAAAATEPEKKKVSQKKLQMDRSEGGAM